MYNIEMYQFIISNIHVSVLPEPVNKTCFVLILSINNADVETLALVFSHHSPMSSGAPKRTFN